MAGELLTAYIKLVPTVQGIQGATARAMAPAATEADKAGKNSGKRFGGGFGSSMKSVMGPAIGLMSVAAAGAFLKGSIAEAREAQKVGALTTSTIRATGGASKITASQVGALSTAISNKSGMDDEAIQSGANLLLTFKNVKNEAGKGNKIFDQATQAAVDLSASGFGSVTGASKMMGKALQDPVKGISALGRAGVTFSGQQKAQIKALVEGGDANAAMASGVIGSTTEYNNLLKANGNDAGKVAKILKKDLTPAQKKMFDTYSEGGHTLEAQKKIMAEVKGQVGGNAAASATAGEKLGVTFGNLKETIGTKLLPVIDKFANFMVTTGVPALYKIGSAITAVVVPAFRALVAGAGHLGTALGKVSDFVKRNKTTLKILAAAITVVLLPALVAWGVASLKAAAKSALAWLSAKRKAISSAAAQVLALTRVSLGWLKAGIKAIAGAARQAVAWASAKAKAIASSAAQLLALAKVGLGWVKAGVKAIAGAARQAAAWVVAKLSALGTIAAYALTFALMAGGWIASGLASMAGAIVMAAAWLIAIWPIALVIAAVVGVVIAIVKNWDKIKSATSKAWNAVKDFVVKAVASVVGFVKSHWKLLLSIITGPIGAAVIFIISHWSQIKSATKAAFNFVKNIVSNVLGNMKSAVSNGIGKVISVFKGIPGKIKGALSGAGSMLKGIGGQIVDGLKNGISNAWHRVTDIVDKLIKKIPKKIREIMGISSPSKVMAEIGKWIPAGLAVGIDSGSSLVARSVDGMISDPYVGASVSRVSQTSGVTASGGTPGGTGQPIYTDTGMLLGWMRTVASGEARIVWNDQASLAATTGRQTKTW